jgi:hypothetical protein
MPGLFKLIVVGTIACLAMMFILYSAQVGN